MEPIIEPVSKDLLIKELTEDKLLRKTNKGGNILYVVNAHNSPNLMREIGRLREEAFRMEGASSGLSMDIDEFDTMETPYEQLIVWDPDAQAIIGGYRFILGRDVVLNSQGQPDLATSHMFHFSDKFIKKYLPHIMELGRSFVAPEYQSSKAGAKAIFSLDNLWDGLCALMIEHPDIMFFFGKMTIYPNYDSAARELIYHFLEKHFPDKDKLVVPYEPVLNVTDKRLMDMILSQESFKDDYKCLKAAVQKLGTHIPPLVNSYMNLSASMLHMGTAVNHEFGEALETAILVNFSDMYEEKRQRHIDSYLKWRLEELYKRFPNLLPGFEDAISARWQHRLDKRRRAFLNNLTK